MVEGGRGGRLAAEAVQELGVGPRALRKWGRQSRISAPVPAPQSGEEGPRSRLEVERQNVRVREGDVAADGDDDSEKLRLEGGGAAEFQLRERGGEHEQRGTL